MVFMFRGLAKTALTTRITKMKAIKKPIIIEYEHFTNENKNRAFNFIACNCVAARNEKNEPTLRIQTLEGVMTANLGDYIIKGVTGEFYPCKPDVFLKTYDLVV